MTDLNVEFKNAIGDFTKTLSFAMRDKSSIAYQAGYFESMVDQMFKHLPTEKQQLFLDVINSTTGSYKSVMSEMEVA